VLLAQRTEGSREVRTAAPVVALLVLGRRFVSPLIAQPVCVPHVERPPIPRGLDPWATIGQTEHHSPEDGTPEAGAHAGTISFDQLCHYNADCTVYCEVSANPIPSEHGNVLDAAFGYYHKVERARAASPRQISTPLGSASCSAAGVFGVGKCHRVFGCDLSVSLTVGGATFGGEIGFNVGNGLSWDGSFDRVGMGFGPNCGQEHHKVIRDGCVPGVRPSCPHGSATEVASRGV
jgi:hypothetical protein